MANIDRFQPLAPCRYGTVNQDYILTKFDNQSSMSFCEIDIDFKEINVEMYECCLEFL